MYEFWKDSYQEKFEICLYALRDEIEKFAEARAIVYADNTASIKNKFTVFYNSQILLKTG